MCGIFGARIVYWSLFKMYFGRFSRCILVAFRDVFWSLFEMYFGRIEKTDWTGLRPLMLWSRVGDGFERFCTVFEIWSVFAKFS